MTTKKQIIIKIKNLIETEETKATIILYGSYARGDYREDSDIDILILIDKEKVTLKDEKRIKYPLYDLEFDTGQIISPLIFSKHDWENRHKITPLYENIQKEGITL